VPGLLRELIASVREERAAEGEKRKTEDPHPGPLPKREREKVDAWWLDLLPYAAAAAAGAFGFGIPWYIVAAWKGYRTLRKIRGRRAKENSHAPPAAGASSSESGAASRRRADDFRDSPGVFDRDLGEAPEYLRLASAEGHAPLQDALVGRIAL
jgi:hypothetical protein